MKKTVILILLLAGACSLRAPAQTQNDYRDVDSTLLYYYRRCNRIIRDTVLALPTADTLFRLAGEQKNTRMQAVALCLKADHYYFTNRIDSLKAWIPRVQAFTRSHNELTHYYFVWQRLVLHYIHHAQYALAQYELEHYLAQAEKDDYKPAIAEAYKQMAHIYRAKLFSAPAAEYYQKAIDYIEANDLERFQLSYLYTSLANVYLGVEQYEKAREAIEKGIRSIPLPEYIWPLRLLQFQYYVRTDSLDKARTLYREIEQGNNGKLKPDQLLSAQLLLQSKLKNYTKVLNLTDELLRIYESQKYPQTAYNNLYSKRAWAYFNLGNYERACREQMLFDSLYMEKSAKENESSLSEFATLLDVNRLDRENAELQQRAQEERLSRNRSIIIGLVLVLALATAFIAVLTRMNRRLARAKRAAEDASRMKGIFIRNITHEINTPLNAIIGFSELAATAPADDPERGAYLDIVQENSGYLQKLVDDVLYISDIESTQTPPALAQTDIGRCCRECIAKIQSACPEGGPEITLRGEEGIPATVCTSRLLVSKVIQELLLNATRFAPGSPVVLAWEIAGRTLTLTVTDTGPGVPEAEAERIFERFVKLDLFSQGLGLGLSVCRLIAQTLGGTIRLDSSYRKGARFVFTVPVS